MLTTKAGVHTFFKKLSQIKLLVVFIQLLNQTKANPFKKLALSLTQCLLEMSYRRSLLKGFLNQFWRLLSSFMVKIAIWNSVTLRFWLYHGLRICPKSYSIINANWYNSVVGDNVTLRYGFTYNVCGKYRRRVFVVLYFCKVVYIIYIYILKIDVGFSVKLLLLPLLWICLYSQENA